MRRIRLIQFGLLGIVGAVTASVIFYIALAPTDPEPLAAGPGTGDKSVSVGKLPSPDVDGVAYDVDFGRFFGEDQRVQFSAGEVRELDDGTEATGGVRVTTEADDGQTYHLTAETARMSRNRQRIRAEGSVRMDRDDGLVIYSDWAEHFGLEKAEVVGGSVRGSHEERHLAADRVEYRAKDKKYLIDGAVSMFQGGEKPTLVIGNLVRATFGDGSISVREDVHLVADGLLIQAGQIDAKLDDGTLRRVLFRGKPHRGILLDSWSRDPPCNDDEEERGSSFARRAPIHFMWTPGLILTFDDEGNPARLTPSPADAPVAIEGLDPPFSLWTMDASRFAADLSPNGGIESLVACDVWWRTAVIGADSQPIESWEAPEVHARFSSNGALETAEFPRGLIAEQEGGFRLHGGRGTYRDGSLRVEAKPSLSNRSTHLTARVIEIETELGEVTATGDVQAQTTNSGAESGLFGGGDLPLHVRSDAMHTRSGGAVVVYSGAARAWRSSNVLTANEIRSDDQFDGIEAQGNVVLRLLSNAGERIEATADYLRFHDSDAILRGNATITSPEINLRAHEVRFHLTAGGATIDRLEADGAPVHGERDGTRTISDHVTHDVLKRETIFTGNVEIIDPDGNRHRGDTVTLSDLGASIQLGSSQGGIAVSTIGGQGGEN